MSHRPILILLAGIACALIPAGPISGQAQPLNFKVLAGSPPSAGCEDGAGAAASFASPEAAAVDGAGNIYIADADCHVIRRVTPGGSVSTFAGLAGTPGSQDGRGSAARFYLPYGVAVDPAGNVYVADSGNHTIRTITPGGLTATLAGTPGLAGSSDGTGPAARFNFPTGLTADAGGSVFVADYVNSIIRMITPAGVVTTFAGQDGVCDAIDGVGTGAAFCDPSGIAINRSTGELFVADSDGATIRKIAPDATVTTYAGQPFTYGSDDGPGAAATFQYPWGVAVDPSGNVYVTDEYNYTIRKIAPDAAATVSTPAGLTGVPGSADGAGAAARFRDAEGIAADGAGNIWVTDWANQTLRRMTPSGTVTTVAGTPPAIGAADATGTAAQFYAPGGVVWSGGSAYVADSNNCTIRKINGAGAVTTLAGSPGVCGTADGSGAAAQFNAPAALTLGSDGNLYVTDNGFAGTIRKVTPAGDVTTWVGTGAGLRLPGGIAADGAGNLFVADTRNNRIMKVDSSGNVVLVAGCGSSCSGSTDGAGSTARFFRPEGIAVTAAGVLYVADTRNHTIRRIATAGGINNVTTVAGLAGASGGADGPGGGARFNRPTAVTVDPAGNLFIADTFNHTLRKMDAAGQVTTLAGTAGRPGGAFGTGAATRFFYPGAVALDDQGRIYVADTENHAIRASSPAPFADAATIDAPGGAVGDARQLDTAPQTATAWQWSLVRRPSGSVAQISPATIRNPVFTPDAPDLHQFRVTATGPGGETSSLVDLLVTDPSCATPVITAASGNQALCAGGGFSLSVAATGPGLSYQWFKNGAVIPGATAAGYSVGSVAPVDEGSYFCRVTACNTVQTATAVVTVNHVAPKFDGLTQVTNGAQSACTLNLAWTPAIPGCSAAITYDVFRSTTPGFTPGPSNRIASGLGGTAFADDLSLVNNTPYYYVARAVDALGNGDLNGVEKRGVATGPVSATTFVDSFEGALSGGGFDNPGWSHAALSGATDWQWSNAQSQSPGHSWRATPQPAIADRVLTAPALGILDDTTISFWHTRAFEGSPAVCYDGGTLEISVNDGVSWNPLPAATFTAGGYDGTIAPGYGNPISGKPAWCGGAIGAMTQVSANLGAYAGQTATLRWHAGEDVSGAGAGWFVDSVTVANAGTAAVCAPACHAPIGVVNNTATDVSVCYNPAIRVDWTLPSNWGDVTSGGRSITVLRDGTPVAGGGCANLAQNAVTCNDTTVAYPQTHSYQVRITNGCGMAVLTSGASATVLTDGTPAGFANNTAADISECAKSGVALTWSLPGDWGDPAGSNDQIAVLRNGAFLYGTDCYIVSPTQTSCTDTSAVEGVTYTYTVRYSNSCNRNAYTAGAAAADFDNHLVTDWLRVYPPTNPQGRSRHGMAFYGSANRTLLFGGYSSGVLGDTWAWNGAAWSSLSPQNSPSQRMQFGLAADEARGNLVLFGGNTGAVSNGETWIWNGGNWVQKFPASSPSPRYSFAMAYDPIRREVVLFGGNGGAGTTADTWAWNGATWTQRFPASAPGPRSSAGMAFDRQRGVMLLYGGYYLGTYLRDTWQWDGSIWTHLQTESGSGARYSYSLVHDEVVQQTIMFNATDIYQQPDWYWDGAAWQPLNTQNQPDSRSDTALSYEASRQEVVLFGGNFGGDTWLLKAPIAGNLRLARNAVAGTLSAAWSAVPRATEYNLYQDASPAGSFTQLTGSVSSGATLMTVPMPSGSQYFKVAAASVCGEGPK